MESRFDPREARGLDDRELLVYVSRLLGAEEELVLFGGGNTSVKTTGTDRLGRRVQLLHIKGSGVDLASVTAADFSALRLSDLEPLADAAPLPDEAMVEHVLWTMVDPRARRPSIETLLHAFLPDRWVLHSHADAVLALANRPDGPRILHEILGEQLSIVGYRRPGHRLAQDVAAARRATPAAKAIVLYHHGLVTFGADARETYENHIAVVTACEAALPLAPLPEAPPLPREEAAALAPRLRGALGRGFVLSFDPDPETRAFLADPALVALTGRGPATLDHMLATKRLPCVAHGAAEVERYKEEYARYAESGDREGLPPCDPAPRVLLVPGLGMFTAGPTLRDARVARAIYAHTMRVIRRAGSDWAPVGGEDAFQAEYWPLEQRKRLERKRQGELEGRVAWISGAGGAIGGAIARRLAREGACVVLADVDGAALARVKGEIGDGAAATVCDVTRADEVAESFRECCLRFGGVDFVVSNAGAAVAAPVEELSEEEWRRSLDVNATSHFLVAREAMRIFRAQGLGGCFVFVASKNVPAPGAGFAAYSAAKAAETQLARVLALEGAPLGVRANVIHPDAVFEGSKLWSEDVRRERARAHGIAPERLEEFYAARNLLKVPVRAEDVAEAALFLASDRSSRTTGAALPVDGGVKEAFPR